MIKDGRRISLGEMVAQKKKERDVPGESMELIEEWRCRLNPHTTPPSPSLRSTLSHGGEREFLKTRRAIDGHSIH
jgi:hypothetical protein